MVKRISAREARERFAELTDRVRYSCEPIVIEKQGHAFVAVVSLEDLEPLEALRARRRQTEFSGLAAKAERGKADPPADEEDAGWDSDRLEAIRNRTWAELA